MMMNGECSLFIYFCLNVLAPNYFASFSPFMRRLYWLPSAAGSSRNNWLSQIQVFVKTFYFSCVNNYLKKSWSMCSMQWHSFFCRFFTSIFGFCQRYVFKIMWFSKIMRNIWYLVDWFLSCNWPVTGPVEWYFVNRFLWCNILIERGEDGRFGGILANCATDKMFNVSLCPPPVIKPSGRH